VLYAFLGHWGGGNHRACCVSIQACPAVLSPIALCDRWKALLCSRGEGRHPGVSGEGVADGGDDGLAVLAGGVEVAADGVAVAGGGLGAEPAGDLLLCDTRSHEVSEHVEEVWLCRRRSYGLVFETVPAVTCVVSNDRVRSSRKNPRAPVPTGCHRCGEGWAWGDYQGILADASSDLLPGSG
jgi:hypothetical protein